MYFAKIAHRLKGSLPKKKLVVIRRILEFHFLKIYVLVIVLHNVIFNEVAPI
jgi:hypothetical protein